MVKHGVVRTDNMAGTDVRAELVSIEYLGADGQTETAIDNGCVLKVGPLKGDATNGYEREIYVGSVPAADDKLDDVVLVVSPELMYDERLRTLDCFYNEAGQPCRGYHFHRGAIFSVTKEALDGKATPEIGDTVELQASIKMKVVASPTASTTTVGEIIAIDVVGRHTYYVVRVAGNH